MKTNNRIKLIVLSVSMLASLGSFATDNSANQNGNQVAATNARQPIQQSGGQYEVRPGETLNQIAARVRPNNMSLSETAKAIVGANPDVFKSGNPDLIFAGDILRIPNSSEITGQASPSTTQQAQSALGAEQPDKSQSSGKKPVKTENKPKSGAEANEKKNKNTQATTAASEITASAAASSTETISSQETAGTASTAQQSSGGSSLPWILVGAVGLAALLFLNKFRGNKQAKEKATATPVPKADITRISTKPDVTTATTAASSAAAAVVATDTSAQDNHETPDDDFSETTEDIFFSDVNHRAEETATNDDFNLDLSNIDNQQGIVSSSITSDEETLKRADADWDTIESTDSIYEDASPVPPAGPSEKIDIASEQAPVVTEDPSIVEIVEFTEINAVEADNEEALEVDTTVTAIEPVEPFIPQTPTTEFTETPEVTVSEQNDVHPAETIDPSEQNNVQLTETFAEAEQGNRQETAIIAEDQQEQHIGTARNIIETEQSAENTVTKDEPIPFEPSTELVTSHKLTQKTEENEREAVETTTSFTDITIEDSTTGNQAQIDDVIEDKIGGLAPDSGFDTVETVENAREENFSTAPISIIENSDDTIEWENVDFVDDDKDVGFISESVGMAAPLEAKYELAQMYIEIGDPDAARETLNELVEEASGDILEKSKALLAEIG